MPEVFIDILDLQRFYWLSLNPPYLVRLYKSQLQSLTAPYRNWFIESNFYTERGLFLCILFILRLSQWL